MHNNGTATKLRARSPKKPTIAKKLARYTTAWLAKTVGCSKQTISNWKGGSIPAERYHEFLRGLFEMSEISFTQLRERSRQQVAVYG